MSNATRWSLVAVTVLLVVGIVVFARGPQHHHGDETGARGSVAVSVPATADGHVPDL